MKIIWTNGCFDIMHPGHIELFKAAKALGDRLIVGIDTDEKVALSFAEILDDLPTPQKIIFDGHLTIISTASLKELFIEFFSFLKACISSSITFFPTFLNFFLFI